MGSSEFTGYCSFTKAIEHLGDRWSLLIVRELGTFGPQGFNELVAGLPGRVSRSVLADRLRRLETLGLVSRPEGSAPHPAYELTAVGEGLMATFGSLRAWADTWLPEDPEMLERDPDVVLGWLAGRVSPTRTPGRRVVLEIRLRHRFDRRYWLVLQHGTEPYGCLTDPLLEETRYVYLECSMPAVLALARGRGDWSEALQDGSVKAFGDPTLVRRLPRWFRPVPAAAARRIRDQREPFRSPADSERVRR
ncbi:MAG TPA: helix-turn-helix domain-containing protein [Lapillicoccus sp.]|nr:helix-turn-helix domain-containing protein [Lapillicoccus sp.]